MLADRERRFTVMLAVTILLTLLFSGLVVADLTNAHRTVATTLTPVPETGVESGGSTAIPGTTAVPGAQGSTVTHSSAAPQAGSSGGATVSGSAKGVPNTGVGGGVIRIGDITTQTGPGRSIPMAHAVVAWSRWVNAHGGINGYRIQLDLRDDQGNADTGAAIYQDYAGGSHSVFAVVGECAPVTDENMTDFINRNHLVMVGMCQAPASATHSPYLWLTGPTPYQNGELGAKLMVALQGWPTSQGRVALACLNDPSTQQVCDGAAAYYGTDALWHGGPQEEAITDNNYQSLIGQWCHDGVQNVHLVLEPGSTQRYLYAAANQSCNGRPWSPPTFENLVIDDGIAHYANAAGMMIGTPWTPLDQDTAGMRRLTSTYQTYYPDEKIDLYAQTSWSYCLLFEHALQLMGSNVTKQNLIDTLNSIQRWDTGIGPVVSYSPSNHVGDVENSLMQLKDPGDNWHLATLHSAIRL